MNTVRDIAPLTWKTSDGRTASTGSATPAWTILNDEGLALTKDGQSPSTWRTKTIALEVAPYAPFGPKFSFSIRLNEPR